MMKVRAWLRGLTDPGMSTRAWPVLDWRLVALLHRGPPVIWIPEIALAAGDFRWGDFGYLPVYRGRSLRAWRAVWPLPLWALHVVGHGVWLMVWGVVDWLWRHGLVHFDSPENAESMLRDLRLGRQK
jgi:hypothetical protein